MKPKAYRYNPEEHGKGCKRLCCNGGGRFYDPRDNIPKSGKNYLKPALYTIGVVALLSLLAYCSNPNKNAPRIPVADLSHKL